MCLVKMKAEIDHDDDEPPRRVTVIRPASREHVTIVRPASARSSVRRISYIEPAPRPSQYVVGSSGPSHPTHNSIPRIVHAPTPPGSGERIDLVALSPRSSRSSVGSRRSTHSRHGSASHSRTRLEDDVRYIARRDVEHRGSRYLSASHSPPEVIDSYGYVEAPRERLYLEEGRSRSRSITYATNPRISRERVLIEENGRRRESYRPPGSS